MPCTTVTVAPRATAGAAASSAAARRAAERRTPGVLRGGRRSSPAGVPAHASERPGTPCQTPLERVTWQRRSLSTQDVMRSVPFTALVLGALLLAGSLGI